MSDAITKLIEAAEKTVAGTYLDEMRPLRIAIAPARAELERMQEEIEQWRSNYAGALEAMNKVLDEASRLRAELAAACVRAQRVQERLDKANVDLVTWEKTAESIAAARAPMVVTDEAIDAFFDQCTDMCSQEEVDNARAGITRALPHLRPAAMPSEDRIADIIYKTVWVESTGCLHEVSAAARAILALLRDGGEE